MIGYSSFSYDRDINIPPQYVLSKTKLPTQEELDSLELPDDFGKPSKKGFPWWLIILGGAIVWSQS